MPFVRGNASRRGGRRHLPGRPWRSGGQGSGSKEEASLAQWACQMYTYIYIYRYAYIYIYMYMYVAYASRILQRPVTTRGSPANGWAAWRSVRGARGSLSGAVGVLGGCPGVLRSFLGISRVSGLVLGRSLGALRGLWGVPGGAWAFLGGPCLSVVSWSCLRHALRKPVR